MNQPFWMVFIAGCLATGSATAQSALSAAEAQGARTGSTSSKSDRHFGWTDKNGDGFISREEAEGHAMLVRDFSLIDTRKDGRLSKHAMLVPRKPGTGPRQGMGQAAAASAATEQPASLSRTAVEAAMLAEITRNFDRIDASRDNQVSKAEWQAALTAMPAFRKAQAAGWFRAADRNGDGILTRQEAEAAGRVQVGRQFEHQDDNQDGMLTQDERRPARLLLPGSAT